MRRVNNLEDVQVVLNDLLNFKQRTENGSQNLKGNQVKNLGDGVADSDAATVGQLNAAISNLKSPNSVSVDFSKTIIWSSQFTPSLTDVLPPYCIVNNDLVGDPSYVWVAAVTPATSSAKSLKINIRFTTSGLAAVSNPNQPLGNTLLRVDLELPILKNGPVRSGAFISPLPKFGLNTILYPVITQVGDVAAVTIGLVTKQTRTISL